MIGDHYGDRWKDRYPWVTSPTITTETDTQNIFVSRTEFEALRQEVADVKILLLKAKRYDEEHSQPDCAMEEKVRLLRQIAELVGVDLEEVFS